MGLDMKMFWRRSSSKDKEATGGDLGSSEGWVEDTATAVKELQALASESRMIATSYRGASMWEQALEEEAIARRSEREIERRQLSASTGAIRGGAVGEETDSKLDGKAGRRDFYKTGELLEFWLIEIRRRGLLGNPRRGTQEGEPSKSSEA